MKKKQVVEITEGIYNGETCRILRPLPATSDGAKKYPERKNRTVKVQLLGHTNYGRVVDLPLTFLQVL